MIKVKVHQLSLLFVFPFDGSVSHNGLGTRQSDYCTRQRAHDKQVTGKQTLPSAKDKSANKNSIPSVNTRKLEKLKKIRPALLANVPPPWDHRTHPCCRWPHFRSDLGRRLLAVSHRLNRGPQPRLPLRGEADVTATSTRVLAWGRLGLP